MPSAISDSGRIDLLGIKAVRLADRARHAFFHQSFEKETKDPALNSVSSGSSNSERKKFSHRENKPPRGPISFLHAALASGSRGMIEFGPTRGPVRKIMRKGMVAVAAVRLRLWLCLWAWAWLRHILNLRQ